MFAPPQQMKLDRGWMWHLLLLSSLAVAVVVAQEELSEADVADVDEDMGLDEELKVLMAEEEDEEEEEEEEAAMVMDEELSDETDGKDSASGKAEMDENVSFQVRNWSVNQRS